MHKYLHNIGDFDKKTRHLTRIERSVYRDLIELYYDSETPLMLDVKELCRKILARTNEEVTAVEQTLNEFFIETPNGWFHSRCEEELDKYYANNSQKAQAGKASAAKKALKKQQALNARSTPVATDVQQTSNDTPTNLQPTTINDKPIKKISRFAPPSVEEVRAYCLERKNKIDPDYFVNHYTANGWMRGKNKIKDWKACINTWENRNETDRQNTGTFQNGQDNRSRAKRVADKLDAIARADIEENGFADSLGKRLVS